jgi:hypothetical protein
MRKFALALSVGLLVVALVWPACALGASGSEATASAAPAAVDPPSDAVRIERIIGGVAVLIGALAVGIVTFVPGVPRDSAEG